MQLYILAVIPVLLPFLVALAVHFYNLLLTRLPQNKQDILIGLAHTAVSAAEQSGLDNPTKKRLAEDTIHTVLASFGVKIDPTYIDAAIESTVLALHQEVGKGEVVAPVVAGIVPTVEVK